MILQRREILRHVSKQYICYCKKGQLKQKDLEDCLEEITDVRQLICTKRRMAEKRSRQIRKQNQSYGIKKDFSRSPPPKKTQKPLIINKTTNKQANKQTTNTDVKKGTAMVLGCVKHKRVRSQCLAIQGYQISQIILTVTPKQFMLFQVCVKTEFRILTHSILHPNVSLCSFDSVSEALLRTGHMFISGFTGE